MSGVTLTPLSVKEQYLRSERRARAIALTAAAFIALVLIVLVVAAGGHDTTNGTTDDPPAGTPGQVRYDGGPEEGTRGGP
jgi:hypothetical protein